eukprot:g2577.t1
MTPNMKRRPGWLSVLYRHRRTHNFRSIVQRDRCYLRNFSSGNLPSETFDLDKKSRDRDYAASFATKSLLGTANRTGNEESNDMVLSDSDSRWDDYFYLHREVAHRVVDRLQDVTRAFPILVDVSAGPGFIREALGSGRYSRYGRSSPNDISNNENSETQKNTDIESATDIEATQVLIQLDTSEEMLNLNRTLATKGKSFALRDAFNNHSEEEGPPKAVIEITRKQAENELIKRFPGLYTCLDDLLVPGAVLHSAFLDPNTFTSVTLADDDDYTEDDLNDSGDLRETKHLHDGSDHCEDNDDKNLMSVLILNIHLPSSESLLSHGVQPNSCPGAVVSSMGFHWINNVEFALLQYRRILRKDGAIFCSFLGGDTLAELRASFLLADQERNGVFTPTHVSPMAGPPDVGALIQTCGLTLPAIDHDVLRVEYKSVVHLWEHLQNMGESNAILAAGKSHVTREVLLATAAAYHSLFSKGLNVGGDIHNQEYDNSEGIIASFNVIHFIAWVPDASQPQPKKRGSVQRGFAARNGVSSSQKS